jgi:hypothetical protein
VPQFADDSLPSRMGPAWYGLPGESEYHPCGEGRWKDLQGTCGVCGTPGTETRQRQQ